MDTIIRWSPLFVDGLIQTIKLFSMALVLELVIALIVGTARLSSSRVIRIAASVYVEFFRGVSVFVQMFWLYYALPFLGIKLSAWEAAVCGLALCHGAYASE